MLISIDDQMRGMAAWAEQQCNAMYANSARGNYTNLSADNRWYYGFLGELVLLKWLQAHYIQYRYEPQFKGRDDTDFYLWPLSKGGKMCTVDVKTASNPQHQYLMMPEAQLKSHPSDVYIGVRINSQTEGEVLGWAVAGDFERIDEKMRLPIPTMGIKLTELRPMSRIFSNSKKLMG